MATAPLLERVLFGHVLTEREARLTGSTAVAVSVGFTGLAVAFYLAAVALGRFSWISADLYSTGVELTGTIVCVLLQRTGRVALACLALLLALLAATGTTGVLQGGMAPQLVGFSAVSVVVAGLLLGSRGAFAMAGAFALMATWFLFHPHPIHPGLATPEVFYAIQLACVAGAAGLTHLGYRRLQQALQVAEQRRLTLELRSGELEASREHFRLIAEHASDLLSEYSLDGRCLYMNQAAWRFSGVEQLPQSMEAGLEFVHPDDRSRLENRLDAVIQARGEEILTVSRVRGADGAYHWMEARTVLFRPPSGEARIVSVTRDISEHKRAEEDLERRVAERTRELEEALEQLRTEVERREQVQESLHRSQHLASIGTLAAGIAHEINNPVGSILAAADAAQSLYTEPAARSEVETLLRKISHEAARCGRIVKSVLALSRQLPNERWIGDLNQVVRSARDHLGELIASNTAQVELELAPNLTPFPMNPTELEQVVVNLVRNAIENGGHGVHVRIRTESAADGIRLRVLDDGPGIPTAERGRIFDPFYTTRRSQGGAGLGLSLVHGIVAGHGGSVEVRGAPGSGTEFVLEFHLAEAHA